MERDTNGLRHGDQVASSVDILEAQIAPSERLLRVMFGDSPTDEELAARLTPEYQTAKEVKERKWKEDSERIFREMIDIGLSPLNDREKFVIARRLGL